MAKGRGAKPQRRNARPIIPFGRLREALCLRRRMRSVALMCNLSKENPSGIQIGPNWAKSSQAQPNPTKGKAWISLSKSSLIKDLSGPPRAFFLLRARFARIASRASDRRFGREPCSFPCLPRLTAAARPPCHSWKALWRRFREFARKMSKNRQNARNSGRLETRSLIRRFLARLPLRLGDRRWPTYTKVPVAGRRLELSCAAGRRPAGGELRMRSVVCFAKAGPGSRRSPAASRGRGSAAESRDSPPRRRAKGSRL